jgi:hypothetical protein
MQPFRHNARLPTQATRICDIHKTPRKTDIFSSSNDDTTLRRGSATATAKAAAERRGELAGGAALLGGLLATAVAALTGSAGPALAVLAAHHAARGSVGALLLDVGGGDDLGGEVEPFAEVVKALETLDWMMEWIGEGCERRTSGVRM